MNIDNRTLASLEFDLILKRLKVLSMAEETPAKIDRAPFLNDISRINSEHQFVQDFLKLLQLEGDFAFSFPSIAPILYRLKPENPILLPEELHALARFMTTAKKFRAYLLEERDLFNKVQPSFFDVLYSAISYDGEQVLSTFDSGGQLLENHPDVVAMNGEKAALNNELKEKSQKLFVEYKEFMQEDRAVIRNGRLLLPVKSNFKGRVKGIIHELSASGNTLFVESVEMIDLNNKRVELDNRLRQIVQKWQKIFSKAFREVLDELNFVHRRLLRLDLYCAKARYARLYNCTRPTMGETFRIYGGVHPALGAKAIPSDFCLESHHRSVVVSGPNAGGKTVLLKTLSLAVLMNQFGMFIHASENSQLPIFERVVSAIGDNQSIEEGASTFSGYMRRVQYILTVANKTTLVLLDELGSGTDPSEGSVLGVAILEAIEQLEAMALVTTHHKDIRNYVQTTSNGINLSMLFDEKLSVPTYQIKLGRPGESRAIEIASANGLPSSLIATAKRLLHENRSESLNLMEQLSRKEGELQEMSKEITLKKESLRERVRELDLKDLQLKQKELELKKEKQREISHFIQESRKELGKLMNELTSLKKQYETQITLANAGDGNIQSLPLANPNEQVEDFFQAVKSGAKERENKIQAIQNEVITQKGYTFAVGMKVLVGNYRRPGEIIAAAKKNKWVVLMESVKITIDESELVPDTLAGEKQKDDASVHIEVVRDITIEKPVLNLDLRGLTLDEAKERLYRQIELALSHHMSQFNVIHGLGTGVLQQGIRKELSKISSVREFHFARPEQGGFGKTEVVLG